MRLIRFSIRVLFAPYILTDRFIDIYSLTRIRLPSVFYSYTLLFVLGVLTGYICGEYRINMNWGYAGCYFFCLPISAWFAVDGPRASKSISIFCGKGSTRRFFLMWPRMWELFEFLFPDDILNQVYRPAVAELLRAYERRTKYRTKAAKRWISFCLCLRTILLVFGCLWQMGLGKVVDAVVRIFRMK